ncbi:MAG: ABC transporter ATP-binding protein, partial [Blautia sp.]|nr:ABC transporter ATP-binding protein [Blautia sp.]
RGFFRSPVMIIGAIFMSFSLSKDLALLLCIAVAFLGCAIALLIRFSSPRYLAMQRSIDGMNNYLEETVGGIKVVKGFVREEYEEGRFGAVNENLRKRSTRALSLTASMMPLSALVIHLTTVLVVWAAGKKIMVGSMQVGVLTAFLTYLTQTLTALNFLANIFLQGTRAAASHRRLSEIFEADINLTDENARERDHQLQSGRVRFEHVTFSYGPHLRPAVEDVSFSIESGEFVGIVGSTGSGKSTMLSLLPRLRDPQEGAVFVDGVNVKDLSLKELRKGVGVVLQNNTLFTGSVAENLRWGKADATQEEMEAALRLSCAWDFVSALPLGLSSPLEQEGANVSGGQRQRLCIAMALLGKPNILLLDDSTSAVDMATDAAIRRGLRSELPGMTKLVVAQRIHSVQEADKIIVMQGGRIEAIGRHEELLRVSQTYRELYESQRKEA